MTILWFVSFLWASFGLIKLHIQVLLHIYSCPLQLKPEKKSITIINALTSTRNPPHPPYLACLNNDNFSQKYWHDS